MVVGRFGHPVFANQRHGQPVRVVGVVIAKTALDAEPGMIGRPILAADVKDLVVLDVVGELAADAAEWAQAVDFAVRPFRAGLVLVE